MTTVNVHPPHEHKPALDSIRFSSVGQKTYSATCRRCKQPIETYKYPSDDDKVGGPWSPWQARP